MTDAREALRDKIIQRHLLNPGTELLDIAIDLVLEEAARVAQMLSGTVRQGNIAALYVPPTAKDAAIAIRALKEKI